jgi:hypothetical protein
MENRDRLAVFRLGRMIGIMMVALALSACSTHSAPPFRVCPIPAGRNHHPIGPQRWISQQGSQ